MFKSLESRHLQTLSAELPAQWTSHNRGNRSQKAWWSWGREHPLGGGELCLAWSYTPHTVPHSSPPSGTFWTLSSGSCQPGNDQAAGAFSGGSVPGSLIPSGEKRTIRVRFKTERQRQRRVHRKICQRKKKFRASQDRQLSFKTAMLIQPPATIAPSRACVSGHTTHLHTAKYTHSNTQTYVYSHRHTCKAARTHVHM